MAGDAPHFEGTACDQIVNQGLLPLRRPEHPPYALDVLSRALAAADHDRDIRGRHIEAFVQHARAHQYAQFAPGESLKCARPFGGPDVTGYGLDKMLPGYGIGGFVVCREYQNAGVTMPEEQVADRGSTANWNSN